MKARLFDETESISFFLPDPVSRIHFLFFA
jgi:hypothetical protein